MGDESSRLLGRYVPLAARWHAVCTSDEATTTRRTVSRDGLVDSVEILGCRLDLLDARAAADRVLQFVRDRTSAQVVTLGTEMVVYAQRDEAFREVVNRCALSVCDTVGLLAVARSRGANISSRVTGVELVEDLCDRAAKNGTSVYLFGGAEGVAADAAAILEAR